MATVNPPVCFCGSEMRLRDGKWGKWWSCVQYPSCDGAVGCHKGTESPLGFPAPKEVRNLRIKAHDALDALWRPLGREWRGRAYEFVAEGIDFEGSGSLHVGHSGKEVCEEIIEFAENEGPEDLTEWFQNRAE